MTHSELTHSSAIQVPAGILPAYCHARLPKAGLGNKLFVWARAYLFSRLNHLPLRVTGWNQLQRTALFTGFGNRLYWNCFKRVDEVGWRTRRYAERHYECLAEPPVKATDTKPGIIYEYNAVPHWSDYFEAIREHRDEVREGLLQMLTPTRIRELHRFSPPIIAVHVRMGDFRKLQPHESFAKVGNVRTPLNYFRELIENIRKVHGSLLPVEIFTDGSARDLAELFGLPGVSLAPKRSTIADILMMSRSRILIASAGSTFSYWAGFLGECALLMHPDHIHKPIRPQEVNRSFYEGPVAGPPESWPALFLENLGSIRVP